MRNGRVWSVMSNSILSFVRWRAKLGSERNIFIKSCIVNDTVFCMQTICFYRCRMRTIIINTVLCCRWNVYVQRARWTAVELNYLPCWKIFCMNHAFSRALMPQKSSVKAVLTFYIYYNSRLNSMGVENVLHHMCIGKTSWPILLLSTVPPPTRVLSVERASNTRGHSRNTYRHSTRGTLKKLNKLS